MRRTGLGGAVLAGGRSTRMGRDKFRLEVAGETLLDRQLRLLAKVGVDERLVALAPGMVTTLPDGVRIVTDREPGLGPLAGLEACLRAHSGEQLLVLAVDLPCLTVEFLRRLIRAAADRGVVPWRNGSAEPLAAIFPRVALPDITSRLDRRELALQPLVQAGLTAGWLDLLPVAPEEASLFTNWNHPSDWSP